MSSPRRLSSDDCGYNDHFERCDRHDDTDWDHSHLDAFLGREDREIEIIGYVSHEVDDLMAEDLARLGSR
jgi:hypothetical protein